MRAFSVLVHLFAILFVFLPILTYADGKSVEIEVVEGEPEQSGASAMAFGLGLLGYLSENEEVRNLPDGVYEPTAEALYAAFSSQAKIWRELRDNGTAPYDYADELVLIVDEGFLWEYVWYNYKSEGWNPIPSDLKIESFLSWSRKRIPEHMPRVEAYLRISEE